MSVILDIFLKYADSVATPEWKKEDIRSGIEEYLRDHNLGDIDDELEADLELRMFKEMSALSFNAYFSGYKQRQVVEAIVFTAKQAALKRALSGETIGPNEYQRLNEQLLQASIALPRDVLNKEWQNEPLEEALVNLKFSAGLSNELSESVAVALCEEQ